MSGYLKQATASQTRTIGAFVDDTDFKTLENALTIANTDILLKKNGAASAAKNSGGATADGSGGMYHLTFDATDTGTVGEVFYSVKVAGALVVFGSFFVLEEAVYDALFAASAPGYLQPTTAGRTLDVSATGEAGLDWANIGAPTTAQNLSGTNIDADQVVASVSGAVGSVTGAVGSVTGAVGSVTGAVGSVAAGGITAASFAANAINAAKLDPDVTTELQAGLATAAALATVDGIVDDILLDTAEIGTAGAGLTNINLPNQTMDIVGNITGNLSGSVGSVTGSVGSVTAGVTLAASAVQAIWDALTSALTTAGSIGKRIADFLTGDAFVRLGAPDGASVSADIADLPTNAELATSQAAADDATLAAIAALNNLSAAQVNAEVDTALVDIHLDHLLAVTYDPASQPGVADALLNELVESDAGVSRYTANALEQAPTGGSAPTVGQIADAVWDEILSGHVVSGSSGEALAAAGTAGDPWTTALPGAYGAGTAGKIVGDNVNATISSRSTQVSVDDLPTNAELATSQAAADDATLAAIAAQNNLSAAQVRTELATELGRIDVAVSSRLATAGYTAPPAAATNASAVRTELTTELGRIDATISSRATPAQVNTEADTALADVGLTSVVTGRIDAAVSTRATPAQVATELGTYDAPTKAELDAAVALLATAANLATLDARFTGARSEPAQGAPAANASALAKLDFVYKLARNRITQDATTLKVYADDAVTVDHKATVSDSGTLYDRGELGTGP